MGTGWYSGSPGILYHWPEVLRCLKLLKKRWYVVQAFSGFEGRVATSLREHIKLHNMEELFGEVMVPTEEVVEIRGGQRRKSERKFFLGLRPRSDGDERRELAPCAAYRV